MTRDAEDQAIIWQWSRVIKIAHPNCYETAKLYVIRSHDYL